MSAPKEKLEISPIIPRTKTQFARYLSLSLVLGFFTFIPISNWYANYKIAYNQARLVALADGEFKGFVYEILDRFYSLWESPVDAASSINGSLWAYSIYGIPVSDPLGLISELMHAVTFPTKYFIGGLIPIVIALTLGRIFCSWMCPMVVLFGITRRVRQVLDHFNVPFLAIKIDSRTRIALFFSGMIISAYWGAWVWHFILPYITVTHEIFSIIIFSSFTVGIYFLIGVLVVDLAVMPGEFCRSVCPTGYLLTVLGKFRKVRISADATKCPPYCVQCQRVCPVDLYPKEDQALDSCHSCMKCVDSCPSNTIKLGFKL
jgi:ferredoxin-type protein NapH